jgi:hypothetical protein
MVKFMIKKLFIAVLLFWPFCVLAEDPQKLLEEAISLVGSGIERNWNDQEIGQKLRDIRENYSQTSQSLSAAAFLSFYLTQIPGDHAKETYELCDEITKKSPKSWQAWMANLAKIATSGLREGENQQTLDTALAALAKTDGIDLIKYPNEILKPLMDQWPPAPTDFTDPINVVIAQQALVLGQYKLGAAHLSKIINPRMKAFGDSCMADYLRDHPQGSPDQSREKKRMPGTVNDSDSSASPQSPTGSQQVTEPPSANTSRRGNGKFIPWFIGLVIIGGSIFFYLRLQR